MLDFNRPAHYDEAIKGATMSQFEDTLCPSTGEQCPALTKLEKLYVGNEGNVDHDQATKDRIMFTMKRTEYLAATALNACEGAIADACPTRIRMDESRLRQGIVQSIRSVREKLRSRQ